MAATKRLSRKQLLTLYRNLVRTRRYDELNIKMAAEGKLLTFYHSGAGHEPIGVGNFPYSINGLAMAHNQLTGAVKILKDARCCELLGVHIVDANATDLIGEAVFAMQLEPKAEDPEAWKKTLNGNPDDRRCGKDGTYDL